MIYFLKCYLSKFLNSKIINKSYLYINKIIFTKLEKKRKCLLEGATVERGRIVMKLYLHLVHPHSLCKR